jgi:thiamine-monophosphate kinase
LGHKALAVSLSDIAAMGGRPIWAMLSLGVSEKLWKTDFLDRFYDGWYELARKYGVELVGGDISRSRDKVVIDSIVGGECPRGKAIMRAGASPGDSIYVSGALGAAAGGLSLLENGARYDSKVGRSEQTLLLRHIKPRPHIILSNILQSLEIVTAMIDISDGLSSDLAHITSEWGIGARVYADRLPIDRNLIARFGPGECLDMALHGGEDYELLLTAKGTTSSILEPLGFTHIGDLTENVGDNELIQKTGQAEALIPRGYRHF